VVGMVGRVKSVDVGARRNFLPGPPGPGALRERELPASSRFLLVPPPSPVRRRGVSPLSNYSCPSSTITTST